MAILKVGIGIKASIAASPIEWAVILVVMSVDIFKNDVIVFNGDVIMYLMSDWLICKFWTDLIY